MTRLDGNEYASRLAGISGSLDETNGKLAEFGLALQGRDYTRAERVLQAMMAETEATLASLQQLQPPAKGQGAHDSIVAGVKARIEGLSVMQTAVRAEIEYPGVDHEALLKNGFERYDQDKAYFQQAVTAASGKKSKGSIVSPVATVPPGEHRLPSARSNHNGLIALSLVLFFPLGLLLMWKYASWKSETKWWVTGIFFWPLWARLLDRKWSQSSVVGLGLFFAVAYCGLGTRLIGISLLIGIASAICTPALTSSSRRKDAGDTLELRKLAEAKLARSDNLVSDAERTVQLDLLPTTSPLRQQYLAALEVRDEGSRRLKASNVGQDIVAADASLTKAVSELFALRWAIMTMRDDAAKTAS